MRINYFIANLMKRAQYANIFGMYMYTDYMYIDL